MNKEQKREWLAAAKEMLDGEEVEYWDTYNMKWNTNNDDPLYPCVRYRPKPKPKKIRIYWDCNEDNDYILNAHATFNKDCAEGVYSHSVLVSTDDLLKIDKSDDD